MVIILKIIGSTLVIGGCFLLGINIGQTMNKRLNELRELERILGMLEGELTYRCNPLCQSFENICSRCNPAYSSWLEYVIMRIHEGRGSFLDIWKQGLDKLKALKSEGDIHLKNEDINEMIHIGQALQESNIDSQIGALLLEKAALHNKIISCSTELGGKKKIALSMSSLGGIMLVILFAL